MWWHDEYGEDIEDQSRSLPTGEMIRRVLPFLRPYMRTFVFSFLMALGGVGLLLWQPVILRQIIDHDIPSRVFGNVRKSGLLYLSTMIISTITGFFSSWLLMKVGIGAVNDIKQKLFNHMLTLGLPWLEKHPVGNLVSRIESDSQRLVSLTSTMVLRVLTSFVMLLGALAVLFSVDVRLFLIAMSIIPVLVVGTYFLFRFLRPRFRQERALAASVSSVIAEFVKAAPLLRLFHREEWAARRLEKKNRGYNRFAIRLGYVEYGIFHGLMSMEIAMTVLALFFGSRWIAEGSLTVGSLVLFAQYVAQIYWPIIMLSEQLAEVQRAGGAADRIFTTLDERSSIDNCEQPLPLPERIERIEFDQVTFSYEPGRPVLKNVSFTLNRSETLALVGPTGGGKSTIINLLTRLREPDEGEIRLNGVDIRRYDLFQYRNLFGLVLQDLYLFPASIQDNLRAFRGDIPGDRVKNALDIVSLSALIEGDTDEHQREVAERGSDLSYGERQLLAFARALTVDPELLVLDEATSSVDPGTERHIQETLDLLLKERTNVVVAHRLSTIRRADQILFIEGGAVLESGSHAELMALADRYRELVFVQTGGEEVS